MSPYIAIALPQGSHLIVTDVLKITLIFLVTPAMAKKSESLANSILKQESGGYDKSRELSSTNLKS